MIEATIVLPIMILLLASMILYSIYEYENLEIQVDLHKQINQTSLSIDNKSAEFDILKMSKRNSVNLGGLTESFLEKKIVNRKYVFDFCKIVRSKKFVLQGIGKK